MSLCYQVMVAPSKSCPDNCISVLFLFFPTIIKLYYHNFVIQMRLLLCTSITFKATSGTWYP